MTVRAVALLVVRDTTSRNVSPLRAHAGPRGGTRPDTPESSAPRGERVSSSNHDRIGSLAATTARKQVSDALALTSSAVARSPERAASRINGMSVGPRSASSSRDGTPSPGTVASTREEGGADPVLAVGPTGSVGDEERPQPTSAASAIACKPTLM